MSEILIHIAIGLTCTSSYTVHEHGVGSNPHALDGQNYATTDIGNKYFRDWKQTSSIYRDYDII